jgi:phosphohistidine phosphatase
MKSLYVVRHAKSSWEHPELKDADRPLMKKGREKTTLVITYLLKKKIFVDKILTSPAVRAYETAKMIAEALNYPIDQIDVRDSIYMADTDDLTTMLIELPQDINSVMLVGHNPELTDLVNMFLDKELEILPTSGVVHIEFKTDQWEDVLNSKMKTRFVVFPRMLEK